MKVLFAGLIIIVVLLSGCFSQSEVKDFATTFKGFNDIQKLNVVMESDVSVNLLVVNFTHSIRNSIIKYNDNLKISYEGVFHNDIDIFDEFSKQLTLFTRDNFTFICTKVPDVGCEIPDEEVFGLLGFFNKSFLIEESLTNFTYGSRRNFLTRECHSFSSSPNITAVIPILSTYDYGRVFSQIYGREYGIPEIHLADVLVTPNYESKLNVCIDEELGIPIYFNLRYTMQLKNNWTFEWFNFEFKLSNITKFVTEKDLVPPKSFIFDDLNCGVEGATLTIIPLVNGTDVYYNLTGVGKGYSKYATELQVLSSMQPGKVIEVTWPYDLEPKNNYEFEFCTIGQCESRDCRVPIYEFERIGKRVEVSAYSPWHEWRSADFPDNSEYSSKCDVITDYNVEGGWALYQDENESAKLHENDVNNCYYGIYNCFKNTPEKVKNISFEFRAKSNHAAYILTNANVAIYEDCGVSSEKLVSSKELVGWNYADTSWVKAEMPITTNSEYVTVFLYSVDKYDPANSQLWTTSGRETWFRNFKLRGLCFNDDSCPSWN